MKLLFAIKSLNVEGGGAERVLTTVANGLSERGHQIALLTFDGPGEAFYPISSNIARFNLDVGAPGKPTKKHRLLGTLPRIRRTVLGFGPNAAVGFMHSMYVPLGVALLGTGLPVIASEHIGADHFRNRTIQRMLVKATGSLFVAKTVPANSIRNEYPLSARDEVFVLDNPVDLAPFGKIEQQAIGDRKIILSVGRFMEQKNHRELIRAFGLIAEQFPEWDLRIVGDGVLRREIEREIEQLGLGKRIELVGMTLDVASEYARSAIVAVPSLYESFGLVAVEALASRRPVVGFSSCPGTNDLVVNMQNGLLVEREGDPVKNLAQALLSLMVNEPLSSMLGNAGPASVDRFDAGAVVAEWEAFFIRQVSGASRQLDSSSKDSAR